MSSSEQKALGLTPTTYRSGFDGVIGIINNEQLAAGGYTGDWTNAAPANNNQYYMLGVIEHELSEVMGRFSLDGAPL
jgi:hypothetical protein